MGRALKEVVAEKLRLVQVWFLTFCSRSSLHVSVDLSYVETVNNLCSQALKRKVVPQPPVPGRGRSTRRSLGGGVGATTPSPIVRPRPLRPRRLPSSTSSSSSGSSASATSASVSISADDVSFHHSSCSLSLTDRPPFQSATSSWTSLAPASGSRLGQSTLAA